MPRIRDRIIALGYTSDGMSLKQKSHADEHAFGRIIVENDDPVAEPPLRDQIPCTSVAIRGKPNAAYGRTAVGGMEDAAGATPTSLPYVKADA